MFECTEGHRTERWKTLGYRGIIVLYKFTACCESYCPLIKFCAQVDVLAARSRHAIRAPKREAELELSSTDTATLADCATRGPPSACGFTLPADSRRERWSGQQWRSRQQGNMPANALGTKQQTLVGSVMPAHVNTGWGGHDGLSQLSEG